MHSCGTASALLLLLLFPADAEPSAPPAAHLHWPITTVSPSLQRKAGEMWAEMLVWRFSYLRQHQQQRRQQQQQTTCALSSGGSNQDKSL